MKKLLIGSIVLTLFSIAVLFVQYSCGKVVIAQSPVSSQALNLSLLSKDIEMAVGSKPDSLGNVVPIVRFATEYYIIHNDGTNATKINIIMPAGEYPFGGARLTADGAKLIFPALSLTGQAAVYSINVNGTGVTKLIDGSFAVQGTY